MYKKVIFGVVIWFIFIAAAVFLQAKTKDIPLGQVKAEILQLITQSSPSKEIDEDELDRICRSHKPNGGGEVEPR